MHIFILGRQPELSIAELESVFGPESIHRLAKDCVAIDGEHPDVRYQGLGGVIKTGEVIKIIPSSRMNKIYSGSRGEIIDYIMKRHSIGHKVRFGLSAYDMYVSTAQMHRLSFDIARRLQKKGYKTNVTIGKVPELNSAQVIHNDLIDEHGYEFLLVKSGEETYLAKTVAVQDIEKYSKRDYGRPRRDTETGMLPPKLAQIMLNLANSAPGRTVLDPFCGTGVVLMEASLKQCKLMGGDIRQQMVDYTKENLLWLGKEFGLDINTHEIARADATTYRWKAHFDCVVSETYLGRQLSHAPNQEILMKGIQECDTLIRRFLINLRPQLNAGSRCCIAIPAWRLNHGMAHLPIISQLEDLGYRRVSFRHVDFSKFIYRRPDQIVAREILVLEVTGTNAGSVTKPVPKALK